MANETTMIRTESPGSFLPTKTAVVACIFLKYVFGCVCNWNAIWTWMDFGSGATMSHLLCYCLLGQYFNNGFGISFKSFFAERH